MPARIDAKPFLDRQLADTGPLLFWRPGPNETRDGMLWLAGACTNPLCSCRDAHVLIYGTDDRLLWAEERDDDKLETETRKIEGRPPEVERRAKVYIDVDTGDFEPDDKRNNDSDLVAWAKEQIDGPLLAVLRRRFAEAKERGSTGLVLEFDSRLWKPGNLLAYSLVHPNAALEIELNGKRCYVEDQHCVKPGCTCEDVVLDFHVVDDPTTGATYVGSVWVAVDGMKPPEIQPEPQQSVLLRALFDEYMRGDPEMKSLAHRRTGMRDLAPEIHRRARKQPKVKARPNGPCPCGSGRKYKKCCLNKVA
jgi:hypothetical protein